MNIFSSALSVERMVRITEPGGEECGAPGDYLSWEEAEWILYSAARNYTVDSDVLCRVYSKFHVYIYIINEHVVNFQK